MKQAQILTLLAIFSMNFAVAKERRPFALVRGRNIEVCEAYSKRLNSTYFEYAPLCDRPENVSVPGFAMLDRVPLTPEDVFKLWPFVGAMEKPAANTSDWTLEAAKKELGRTILAWRYEPNVDIQNSGSSQTVIMWRGSRMESGVENSNFACGRWNSQDPQLAFILDTPQSQVDQRVTKSVFWRAKPAILGFTLNGELHRESVDLPIGRHMSIFKYKDLYYFDTFYSDDGWGDYQNRRRKDKTLEDTLAVFLNRNGETREICELRAN
jgi:hypothetical protein